MNYTDPSGHWVLGYWSRKQHYYAFYQNAPQKKAGYNDFYDMMSWTVGDLVTQKIKTSKYRLQFWKGKYGPPYIPKVANGCEIGLYYRNNENSQHWYCAYQQKKRLRMKMSLYVNGKKMFTRDSKTSTKQGKAWWLTGFVPIMYLPRCRAWSKTSLKMTGVIWFPKTKDMKKLSNKLKENKQLGVGGNISRRTFSWKGR